MKVSISAIVAAVIAGTAASTGSAGISGSGAAVNGISGSGMELLVVGPVEAVDTVNRTATILGQRIQTTERIAVGDAVAVYGVTRPDGSISATSIQLRGLYVAGATPIFLSGTVQKAEPSLGRHRTPGPSLCVLQARR